jgi:tetratricopeptide (TPR) repeat protein
MVVMLCGVGSGLSAQQFNVTYLDGRVEVQSSAEWVQLSIGDRVSADSKLTLGEDSYVELSGAGALIRISQPGRYSIHELFAANRKLEASSANAAIAGVLRNLVTTHTAKQSTAMGARAANEGTQQQDNWVYSTAQVSLEDGKEFIESGEYTKAIERFHKALNEASAGEAPEIKYYLAYAYSLDGNTRDSFKQLSEVQPAGGEEWASDYALLKAKLLLDTNAFNPAITLLTGQGEVLQQDEQRAAMYFFLLALGYRGIGDTENEKTSLTKVISMPSDSNVAYAASELLKTP